MRTISTYVTFLVNYLCLGAYLDPIIYILLPFGDGVLLSPPSFIVWWVR